MARIYPIPIKLQELIRGHIHLQHDQSHWIAFPLLQMSCHPSTPIHLLAGPRSCNGAAGMCGSSMMRGKTSGRRTVFPTINLLNSIYPCLISTLRNLLGPNPSTPAVSYSRWVSNVLYAYFLDRVLVWLTVDGNVLSRHTGHRSLRYKGLLPVRPVRMRIAIYTQPLLTSRSSSMPRQKRPDVPM